MILTYSAKLFPYFIDWKIAALVVRILNFLYFRFQLCKTFSECPCHY